MNLDEIDAKLLNAIQLDCKLTSDQLSELAHLSPTACKRRLNRMHAEGIIEGEVAIVSPKAVGRPLSMLVLVSLARERADIIDTFKQSIRSTPEVMNGYYVTGEVDFVLVITAESMAGYEQFTRDFFYKNPDIKTFKTLVVMDRVKSGFTLPIRPTWD